MNSRQNTDRNNNFLIISLDSLKLVETGVFYFKSIWKGMRKRLKDISESK